MTEELLQRLRDINPEQSTHEDSDELAAVFATIDARRSDMTAHQNTPRNQQRRWAPAAIAAGAALLVVVAVSLPILFLGGEESTVTAEPTSTALTTAPPATAVPTTPQTTVAPASVAPFPPSELAVLDLPLSEAIPGFADTIVMTTSSGDGYGVMRWRSSESMTELLLSPERNGFGLPGLDASARWVGKIFDANVLTIQAVPTVPGEPSRREIVGHDVQIEAILQAVWHDTEPGRLAWLECPDFLDGPTTLVTLNTSDPSADPIRLRSFDQGCRANPWGEDESDAAKPVVWLERWDSMGVWVTKSAEDAEGRELSESVIVDADGTETPVASDAGMMIAKSPDGRSIWEIADNSSVPGQADQLYLSSADGQYRSTVPGFADGAHLYGAWWSPDGTRLAMWLNTDGGRRSGDEILRTVDSVSGEVITEIAEPALDGWGPTLAWSTDGRFLVYKEVPLTDTAVLVIHDIATNTTTKIPLSEDVDDIRVR